MSRAAVSLAVRLLPIPLRSRYREQWNADLRDAEEAGIPPASIAAGALTFAATVSRPMPWTGRAVTPDMLERRGWLAAGLSLGAAVLGLSQYANVAGSLNGLTGNSVYDYFVSFTIPGLGLLYAIFAVIFSVAIVAPNSGIDSRVRIGVGLLVLAILAPVGANAIARLNLDIAPYGSPYLASSNIVYLLAAGAIVCALNLLWRAHRSTLIGDERSLDPNTIGNGRRVALVASVVTALLGSIPFALQLRDWTMYSRAEWSYVPGLTLGSIEADGSFVERSAGYDVWLSGVLGFEQRTNGTFVGWAVGLLAIAVAAGAVARIAASSAASVIAAGLCLSMMLSAGILDWLWFNGNVETPVSPLLMMTARVAIVAIALVKVGRFRIERPSVTVTAG